MHYRNPSVLHHPYDIVSSLMGLMTGAVACAAAPAFGQCQPTWSTLPHTGQATAFAAYDEDGDGPAPPLLFIGGVSEIGVDRGPHTSMVSVGRIAMGDGWKWYSPGEGFGLYPPYGLYGTPPGTGHSLRGLYAGVDFAYSHPVPGRGVLRWHRGEWAGLGSGMATGYPYTFILHDDGGGPALFAGGQMSRVQGDPETRGIARWNGQFWSNVAGGIESQRAVKAFAIYTETHGGSTRTNLFVAGTFRTTGGMQNWRIARWDGQSWSTIGELGADQPVDALCVFDAGDGPMLYVGGSFSRVGGPSNWITAPRLARWDGKEWSAVPGWTAPGGGNVRTMAVWDDDGPGPNKPALFIGGYFFGAAGTNASSIIKWDGERWDDMQGGVTGFGRVVDRIHAFDDDHDGPNPGGLYIGGTFTYAGGVHSLGLARWGCPLTPPCLADCDFSTGFGVLDVFDFLCFANRFHAGAPYACDCDTSTGHGVCDIFDFLCFGQRFQRGCD